jgi:hypothetical protein
LLLLKAIFDHALARLVNLYYTMKIVFKPGKTDGIRILRTTPMMKHYILNLNPTAKHEWDRCIIRDPLTAKRPDIAKIISEAIGADTGSYLVSVNIEVTVLQEAPIPSPEQLSLPFPEVSVPTPLREAA